MDHFFDAIHSSLQAGDEIVRAIVIDSAGSTPRGSGAGMIIHKDGTTVGTIGGGAVEADVIRAGLELFATRLAIFKSYHLDNTQIINDMDLICGGRMRILLEYLAADETTTQVYDTARRLFEGPTPFFMVTAIDTDGRTLRAIRKTDHSWLGSLSPGSDLLRLVESLANTGQVTRALEAEGRTCIVEGIMPPTTLYLVGGGHVARETAHLAARVGFRSVVFDDRAEFANHRRFPKATGVHVRPGFVDLFKDLGVTEKSSIVIVTRGHRFDREALAQALRTRAGYIGMIGSRRKREAIYNSLREEGVTQTQLERVHCPIGLDIGAETPAEIGVSIVSQLIEQRAAQRCHG